MSTFSSCPKCAKPITVPRGAEPADMVRCPLCQAEYMLAEALANAPPELLVLRTLGIVSREEPHAEIGDLVGTDLHLFDHASSDLSDGPLSDGPVIDLGDSPEIDEEELAPKFDVSDEDTLPGNTHVGHSDPDQTISFDAADHDTDIEELAAEATHDRGFDLEEPAMDFNLADAADEESPRIDEGQPHEEVDLAGFGDDAEDAPILDMPDDEMSVAEMPSEDMAMDELPADAEVALAGAESGGETGELEAAPKRERRKPSMLAGLIIWSTSLPVAAVLAYAILLWALGKDPLVLAPKVPSSLSFLVPSALAHPAARPANNQIAQAPAKAPEGELPGFNTNVPPLTPRENGEKPIDPTTPKTAVATPDDEEADEPADETPAPVRNKKPVPADDEAGDDAAGDDAADDTMPDEPEDETPAPVRNKKPVPGEDVAGDDAADENMTDEPEDEAPAPVRNKKPVPAEDVAGDDAAEEPTDDTAMTDEPAATEDTDDVAATEPADVPGGDVAAPEEATEPTVAVGPRDNMHYSADDVEKGMTEAQAAAAALATADKDALKKAKAQYYRKLAQLAEFATFAEDDSVEPEGDLSKIKELISEVAADRAQLGVIAKAAGQWMNISKGKEHQGIVLAGTVQSVTKQGNVYETKVLLTDGAQVVTVLSAQKLPVKENDQTVVLGSIVSDPATTIEGYQGAETTAVWCGMAIKAPAGG